MITMRLFKESDRAALIALWQACGLTRPWNDPDQDISFCIASPAASILVAEENGAVIGSAMVGHDGHRGWIYYVAVSPTQQKAGLGRKLMAAAEDWCRQRGVPKLMLMVRPENAAVPAFYETLGYGEEQRVIFSRRLYGVD